MHDIGGRIKGNESARAAEIKGKIMDQKDEEHELKDSNPHSGKESKSKKNKQPKESEESTATISGSDDKMKEDVIPSAGIVFTFSDYFLVLELSQMKVY